MSGSLKQRKAKQDTGNIGEKLAEVLAKIQLLDGDRRAFKESNRFTSESNEAKIEALRSETKELMRKYRQTISCDEDTIHQVFKGHDLRKQPFLGKKPQETIEELQYKKCDQIKRFNLAQYQSTQKNKELEALIKRMKHLHKFAERNEMRDREPTSHKFKNRVTATEIEKYKLRNTEADEMLKYFTKIAMLLREENKMYLYNLDELDKAIEENEEELEGLEEMHRDAESAKEMAKLDLQYQEGRIEKDKKSRHRNKNELKKVSDRRDSEFQKINDLIALQEDYNNRDPAEETNVRRQRMMPEATIFENKVSDIEQSEQKVKDKTGLQSSDDAIEHFRNQFETKDNLERQIDRNSETINDLRGKRKSLSEDLDDLKLYGSLNEQDEPFVSSTGDELNYKPDLKQAELAIAEDKLNNTREQLKDLKQVVDHLKDKLARIRASRSSKTTVSQQSELPAYVAESLEVCAEKIRTLLEEIGPDTDVKKVLNEIEDSDFNKLIQDKMASDNARVETGNKLAAEGEYEAETSSDDDEVLSRKDLKKASKALLDSKANRRGAKKNVMRFR